MMALLLLKKRALRKLESMTYTASLRRCRSAEDAAASSLLQALQMIDPANVPGFSFVTPLRTRHLASIAISIATKHMGAVRFGHLGAVHDGQFSTKSRHCRPCSGMCASGSMRFKAGVEKLWKHSP